MSEANGTLNGKSASPKRKLLRNPTATYRPQGNGWSFLFAQLDGSPFFTWVDIPRMLRDPRVRFCERMWRAPFQRVKWTVRSEDPRVSKFVGHTLRKFWRGSLPKILSRYFRYGFGCGGAEFAARRGAVRFDRVRCVEPTDARPLVWTRGPDAGKPAGFTLARNGAGTPWSPPVEGGDEVWVSPGHAFWFAGHGELGPWWDMPVLAGMFEPWSEKRTRGGAVALRRAWYRKSAARGAALYHPPGETNIGTDESPVLRNNQDIARETLDYAESNSTLTFSNEQNSGMPGEYAWKYVEAQSHPDVAGFREYPQDLDREMLEGAGIPPEVLEAAEVGSGWSGRLIPLMGFLGGVDELAGMVVESADAGWVRALVEANFGRGTWYEVEPLSLAEEVQQQAKGGGENPVPGLLGLRGDPEESRQMSWAAYEGSHGGKGWKNDETGEVRYQERSPDAGGGGAEGGKVRQILRMFRNLPRRAVKKARAKVQDTYRKLEQRYGPGYARVVVGAGIASLPVPIPGAAVAFAAPVLAVAELHRRLMRWGAEAPPNVDTEGVVKPAARWFLARVFGRLRGALHLSDDRAEQYADHVPENPPEPRPVPAPHGLGRFRPAGGSVIEGGHAKPLRDTTIEEFAAGMARDHTPPAEAERQLLRVFGNQADRVRKAVRAATAAERGRVEAAAHFHLTDDAREMADGRAADNPTAFGDFDAAESLFPEERDRLAGSKAATKKRYRSDVQAGLADKSGRMPGVSEIKALAEVGEPAKGGYAEARRTVEDLLGSHADADRWTAINAILSARTGWEDHTAGAVEALARWHAAGRPTTRAGLDAVFGTVSRRPDGKEWWDANGTFRGPPGTMDADKAKKIKNLLALEEPGVEFRNVSKDSLKTPNFGKAFVDPRGVPIDTHMAKLTVPGRDEGFDRAKVIELARYGEVGRKTVSDLLDAQKKLIAQPAATLAYKTLVAKAAADLGWEPREVQEAAWTAAMAVAVAKHLDSGGRAAEILKKLNRRAIQAGWSLNTVLKHEGVQNDLGRLGVSRRRILAAIARSKKRLPAGPGEVRTGDPAALESAAQRLRPGVHPAARPIKAALVGEMSDGRAHETHPEEAAFHRQLRDDPDDDTARLAYADWLAGHDRGEEAGRVKWHANHRAAGLAAINWNHHVGVRAAEDAEDRLGRLPEWQQRLYAVDLARAVLARHPLPTGHHEAADAVRDALHVAERHAFGGGVTPEQVRGVTDRLNRYHRLPGWATEAEGGGTRAAAGAALAVLPSHDPDYYRPGDGEWRPFGPDATYAVRRRLQDHAGHSAGHNVGAMGARAASLALAGHYLGRGEPDVMSYLPWATEIDGGDPAGEDPGTPPESARAAE